MVSVRQVQHPEIRHDLACIIGFATQRPIEAAASKLRLAFRQEIYHASVVLDDIDCTNDQPIGLCKVLGMDKVKIVAGRMVFRERGKLAALKSPDWKIEPG